MIILSANSESVMFCNLRKQFTVLGGYADNSIMDKGQPCTGKTCTPKLCTVKRGTAEYMDRAIIETLCLYVSRHLTNLDPSTTQSQVFGNIGSLAILHVQVD